MNKQFKQYWDKNPEKGGLIGALLGLIIAHKTVQSDEPFLKKAGKTAALTGAGFIVGQWIEKWITGKNNHSS